MSWEIFVTAFEHGKPFEFETAILRKVFERDALPHPAWPPANTDYLYDDGHIRMGIGDHGLRSDGFVARRIFGQTAIARLLEAAATFNCLIFWPAGEGEPLAAVACESTLAHLPPDAKELAPLVTTTPGAFIEVVGFSSPMTKEEWIEAETKYREWYEQNQPDRRP